MLGHAFLVHPGAFVVHVSEQWRALPCADRLLPPGFCRALEVAQHAATAPPEEEFWQDFRGKFARFVASLPVWTSDSLIPAGLMCHPPALASMASLSHHYASEILMRSFMANTERVATVASRLHRLLKGQSDGIMMEADTGTGEGVHREGHRDLKHPDVLRQEMWKACLGTVPLEGRYVAPGLSGEANGKIIFDRRLLEGGDQRSLDLRGAEFQHALILNEFVLSKSGILSAAALSDAPSVGSAHTGSSGKGQGSAQHEVSYSIRPPQHPWLDDAAPDAREQPHNVQAVCPSGARGGARTDGALVCRLLTNVSTAGGAWLVQRDLFLLADVSADAGAAECLVPDVLLQFCGLTTVFPDVHTVK